jgi:hypothetical protein
VLKASRAFEIAPFTELLTETTLARPFARDKRNQSTANQDRGWDFAREFSLSL